MTDPAMHPAQGIMVKLGRRCDSTVLGADPSTCSPSRHHGKMVAMPIPEFITALRSHVGHAPLWLSGVSGVVRDDHGRILLTHRADTAEWAVVSGVLEPGE